MRSQFLEIRDWNVNYFHVLAPKYSLPSGFIIRFLVATLKFQNTLAEIFPFLLLVYSDLSLRFIKMGILQPILLLIFSRDSKSSR